MKKIFCFILIFALALSGPIKFNRDYCFAESNQTQLEIELNKNLQEQLASLDLSKLDEALESLGDENFFKSDSFSQKIASIVSGELAIDGNSFVSYILKIVLDDVIGLLPYICLIIAIAVLYNLVSSAQSGKSKGVSDIIHFVCYGAIVVIVIGLISSMLAMVKGVLGSTRSQMEGVFPVLLTVLTALGGSTSVSVYQPAMAMLSGTVISIFINVLLPIFTFMLVFNIISNLTTNIKFDKFGEFFGSLFKWLTGIILTLFSAFVSINGLMAGAVDTVGIKATKYTIKSAVPLVGGFVADGMGLIMISSMLVKNAVGVGGLVLMFSTIISPIINIIAFSLLLRLTSAILEPIADGRVTKFISSIAKSIQLLTALVVGVAFMYLIMIGLVMCSANVI